MLTSLHEPQLLQGYYEEFLKQINLYQNIMRTGVFVKYFNINVSQSIYEEHAKSTFDNYSVSEVKFDIYELTPVFYIAPVSNSTMNVQDLDGQRIDGSSTLVLYTIKRPRIHDLIHFTHPIKSDEIFRITNVRPSVNMMHSEPAVGWFDVDIDYAPIKDTSKLKIENHYVYDLSKELNIPYKKYVSKLEWLNDIQQLATQIMEYYYPKEDVYVVDNFIPIQVNEIMIEFKKLFAVNWNRLFDGIQHPYGFFDYLEQSGNGLNNLKIDETKTVYPVFDLDTNTIIDLELEQNSEVQKLIMIAENLRVLLLEDRS